MGAGPGPERARHSSIGWTRSSPAGAVDLLDVGIGTGNLALPALARWPSVRVTGIDASGEMVRTAIAYAETRLAPHAHARLTAQTAFADALPFPDGTFDARDVVLRPAARPESRTRPARDPAGPATRRHARLRDVGQGRPAVPAGPRLRRPARRVRLRRRRGRRSRGRHPVGRAPRPPSCVEPASARSRRSRPNWPTRSRSAATSRSWSSSTR